jgi:hypothetical protein
MNRPTITTLSKTYNNLYLDRLQKVLRVDDFDAVEVKEIYEDATDIAEKYLNKNIAFTTTQYTFDYFNYYNDYINYAGQYILIDEGNYHSMSGVTSTDKNGNVTNITGYTVIHKDSNTFNIHFNNNIINSRELKIVFYTGYKADEMPKSVRRAIYIIINDLYDWERASYSVQQSKKGDAIERYLNPFRKDFFYNYDNFNFNYFNLGLMYQQRY